jgi:alginate O-acetyltransferase complex protein AlgI
LFGGGAFVVFSSLVFLFQFLPITLILYFLSPNKTYRNLVLIISSLFFYAWGEPVWVTLLIFTSFFDYFNGLTISKFRGRWQSKFALAASIMVNLGILFFFKYSEFLTININHLLGLHLPYSTYKLPIGISFYTFQTLSYVVDVYRGEVEAQKSPLKLLLFVSLFHQLVAGPIVRYIDVAQQIENRIITYQINCSIDIISLGINF